MPIRLRPPQQVSPVLRVEDPALTVAALMCGEIATLDEGVSTEVPNVESECVLLR